MQIENSEVSAQALTGTERASTLSAAAVRFLALLAVASLAPALDAQALTGTLVNAALFLAVALLGVGPALLLGILPSVISSVTGLLPAALWPMVPFIILSNALLVVSFRACGRQSYWRGVLAGSVLKFILLAGTSSFVIGAFVSQPVADKLALMMSWPQLFTALTGGILAHFVLGVVRREK